MSLYDLAQETLLSLTGNKVRSFLTILGIVVGIASVILMVSIGQGSQASITSSIEAAGSNLLQVSSFGRAAGGFGRPGGPSGGGSEQSLTQSDVELVKTLPGVAVVAASSSGQYTASTPGASVNLSITGVGENYEQVKSIEASSGSFISNEDIANKAKVCVLGATAASDLFAEGTDPLGQKVRINGINFTVVGVLKATSTGNTFFSQDEIAYVPLSTMQLYLIGSDSISSIAVEAQSSDVMDTVQTEIQDTLMASHNISDTANATFQVANQATVLSTASTITNTFTLLLASIAGISLVVGGIGIMNMMLTTVTERTREIGLRKAIGARRSDITSQFLAEAVTLCLTGGVIGIAIGWGAAAIVNATGVMTTVVSVQSIVLATGVCAAIGVVFGYYPARAAAKLDPIESLRYQ